MGIPKKGSRRFEVGGKFFRYLVKETHIPGHRDQKELTVTVQEDTEAPGRCLQFRWGYGCALGPNDVREVVQDAIQKKAWDPSSRGTVVVYANGWTLPLIS